ncbi:hypothetical protein QYB59_001649 [Clostridium perfringens]|nr:hypothetical protein [Clostridium perfringens]
MSKFDEFDLDVKNSGSFGAQGNEKGATLGYICLTVTTVLCGDIVDSAKTKCGATACQPTATCAGCSGNTCSACRSYCGSSC